MFCKLYEKEDNDMPNNREVASGVETDKAREATEASKDKKKGKWSPGKDATIHSPSSPEQEYLTEMAKAALEGGQKQERELTQAKKIWGDYISKYHGNNEGSAKEIFQVFEHLGQNRGILVDQKYHDYLDKMNTYLESKGVSYSEAANAFRSKETIDSSQ